MTTWAIFGGSFNPPHVGHVLAGAWVLSTQDVDELVVVPALEHAFGKELAPYAHRRRMTELAFGGLRRARVSDVEARMGRPSYTVRTLERLRAEHPSVELRLVIGSDLVDQLPSWKEGHRIPALAAPLVVGRAGHHDPSDGAADVLMPEVSSTEIRRRLAAGEPADALVPRAVLAHVDRYGLYGLAGIPGDPGP